jgi:hypothetical protein
MSEVIPAMAITTAEAASPTGDQLLALGVLLSRSGKIIESEISGTSMGNTLPPGSRIRIRQLQPKNYRPGQVVAFVSGHTVFAHRIISCSRQGVLTRGDNRSWCDLPLSWCAVLGLVTENRIGGEWRQVDEHPLRERRSGGARRAVDALLRVSLKIDIRLARFASRTLMSVALWRHRLLRSKRSPEVIT